MPNDEVILRFSEVSFNFNEKKPILDKADFSLRRGSKITLMGQNGAGKSTIFKMITKDLVPAEGQISVSKDLTVATARQVMSSEELGLSTRDYFAKAFKEIPFNLDKLIKEVLEVVNLVNYDLQKQVSKYSGGQQARLLLAFALIQAPDLLLLDEPTNNLDTDGVAHLTGFLMMYEKTCLVISHDADFLNSFSDGVLYLDVHTQKIEQYAGDYFTVVEEIAARVEREQKQNTRMERQIQEQKDKINFFANKGGKMRKLASKLRDQVEEAEDNKVQVRREDRTIRDFEIPCQEKLSGEIANLNQITVIKNNQAEIKKVDLSFRKGTHIQLSGPNGIGKTTLLESLASGKAAGMVLSEGLKIGYYRQDFSTLDYNKTVRDSLLEAMGMSPKEEIDGTTEQFMRSTAAGFLIDSKIIGSQIGHLSEGQKGLVAFCHLVLEKPGLLILDEPTNHINFRHLPIIAQALDDFEGAMILVSHVSDFVSQIRIDSIVHLDELK
jgi:ATPase subunit of ABC transporter with duplicated ATPase domains